mmetsp:Transcript_75218/g.67559  ORF Transcript_75218/g.67559 Transcript_75218/m.67559 type:complete len:107 (-) Transcript_75218:129-449(-)
MSFWRFVYWSLRTADWAVIGSSAVAVSVGGYAIWDWQQRHQKEQWDPTPIQKREDAGRFGGAFPVNEHDYKKSAKKPITLEELEWNIKDRERKYQQYMEEQRSSKS